MVKYVQGNIFDGKEDILAHGVNCKGAFGAGIAGQIASRYPKAQYYYRDKFDDQGWRLGEVQYVRQWDGRTIANCATQYSYRPAGKVHVNYEAVRDCLSLVKNVAKGIGYQRDRQLSVALPKIGAGLAGGDWYKIKQIIEDVFSDYDCTVYYLEGDEI